MRKKIEMDAQGESDDWTEWTFEQKLDPDHGKSKQGSRHRLSGE